jgi:hypothetical protein
MKASNDGVACTTGGVCDVKESLRENPNNEKVQLVIL